MRRNCEWTSALLVVVFFLATASTIGDVSAAQPDAPVEVADDFDGSFRLRWETRNPDASHVSLDKRPGTLTITTQQGGFFHDNTSYKNLMLVENPVQEDGDFELTTCLVSFAPFANVQQAGLVCFNDEDNYIKWVCEWHDVHGGRVFSLVRETEGRTAVNPCGYAMGQGERVWLRLTKRGNWYEYASSRDGESFQAFGETTWVLRREAEKVVRGQSD